MSDFVKVLSKSTYLPCSYLFLYSLQFHILFWWMWVKKYIKSSKTHSKSCLIQKSKINKPRSSPNMNQNVGKLVSVWNIKYWQSNEASNPSKIGYRRHYFYLPSTLNPFYFDGYCAHFLLLGLKLTRCYIVVIWLAKLCLLSSLFNYRSLHISDGGSGCWGLLNIIPFYVMMSICHFVTPGTHRKKLFRFWIQST